MRHRAMICKPIVGLGNDEARGGPPSDKPRAMTEMRPPEKNDDWIIARETAG